METHRVTMADDAYLATQSLVAAVCGLLLDPECLGGSVLDRFVDRADRSEALAPILHPSEFRTGGDKLHEVLECARALRDAASKIKAIVDPAPDSPRRAA